jgi:hypothetical protein
MTASETFQYLADLWNSEFAKGSNKVYKKYPEHLSMYYKKWAKNQARDTAVKEANVDKLGLVLVIKLPCRLVLVMELPCR